jgi:acetyl-CoA carboxylase/biotin carboxylase 1
MEGLGFFKNVSEFVEWSDGDHAIEKILIANNGIGATKAIRSIRKWSFETFGNERAIQFVVMATPEDTKANAEYIRMADQVVDVPGGSNNNNYANVNLICEIATRLKVDAVMPMWGHASENPSLPTSLKKLGHRVTFIGPSAGPMQALGDKIGSTIIAQSAGVPTIAWNGNNLTVDYQATGIPDSVYDEANVKTAEAALECADRIGYPVMIKASEGGGGKGIRKVLRSEEVLNLYRQVQSEIPGSPIFVMKMASNARHLEVQLLADQYGEAIALSGRDCSVQRRHQKIIEEGPPTAAPSDIFKAMEKAAVSLAKTVGYSNAGTVEYLFMEETNEFAFLELNPRLQVEHPVTENILGLNLPACQLQVAMGIPLHRIADVRRLYGRHPRGKDTIDFAFSERQAPPRHCIAVRITAENPEEGFQPTSGKIKELQFRSNVDVWGYFSIDNSGLVHEFADSQFGHIFAGGRDRESARRAMIVALKELQIRGDIRTTVEYIIKVLQSSDFVDNNITTDWLDGRLARYKELAKIENEKYCPAPQVVASCGAALQGFQRFQQRDKTFIELLKVGQVSTRQSLATTVSIDLIYNNVKYITTCTQRGPETVVVTCNGASQFINVRPLADGGYLMNVDGRNHLIYSQLESGGSMRMTLDGNTCLFPPEYDPTKFISSVAGKIARLLVPDNSHVNAGDAFIEIEVMKMYMPLKAQESGIMHFQMSEGATLSPGDIIAKVSLDNPDSVVHAEVFQGVLSISNPSDLSSAENEEHKVRDLPHIKLREATSDIEKVLEGYPLSDEEIKQALYFMNRAFRNPLLPVLRVEEALSVLRGRIDDELSTKISTINSEYRDSLENTSGRPIKYPAAKVLVALQMHNLSLSADRRAAFLAQTLNLWTAAELFVYTIDEVVVSNLVTYMDAYNNVEKNFDSLSFSDVSNQLRKENSSDLEKVLHICRSHVNVKAKNTLMVHVLDILKAVPLASNFKRPDLPANIPLRLDLHTRKLKSKLTELSKLHQGIYSSVAFAANLLLMDQFSMSSDNRRHRLHDAVIAALTTGDPVGFGDRVEELQKFIDNNVVIRDLIIDGLRHDSDYQLAVLECYLRKIYQKNHGLHNVIAGTSLADDGTDRYPWISFEFVTMNVDAVAASDSTTPSLSGRNISFSDLANTPRLASSTTTFSSSLSPSHSHTAMHSLGLEKTTEKPRNPVASELRFGILAVIDNFSELSRLFPKILEKISDEPKPLPINVMHIIVMNGPIASQSDDETSLALQTFLMTQAKALKSKYIRRVSFFVGKISADGKVQVPSIFTFRQKTTYQEDRLYRHVEAPHAFHLDLPRLSNFNIYLEEGVQISSGNVNLYRAVPKSGKGYSRYFARIVSFSPDVQSSDLETLFVEALDHLSLTLGKEEALGKRQGQKLKSAANHFFVNIVSNDSVLQPEQYDHALRRICTKYWYKMSRLAVTTVELKLTARLASDAEPLFLRLVATNPTGYVLKIDKYYESVDNDQVLFKSLTRGATKGPWEGLSTDFPYSTTEKFEIQRAEAMAASDTLYCYDWPILLASAAEKSWEGYPQHVIPEEDLFECRELVLCDNESYDPFPAGWAAKDGETRGVLVPSTREPGLNDVGMVAWHMRLKTPEYPQGRDLVVICNDITYQAGSFGTKEDILFFKASEYARTRGLPRIFLAANSGARIGMAQSLKSKFRIAWNDEADPAKGYRYIFLTQDDYDAVVAQAHKKNVPVPVICKPIEEDGVVRYMISDIIGEEADLGVENLMGSGLIAGETARAYNEIFTLTIVVGRTVGIGAYLVRLGQRTIQKTRNAPIILTGFQALNKLMGKEIYTTNDQLGGPMIMYPNGVSHLLAETHFEAVLKGLDWLSYVPAMTGAALPIRTLLDNGSDVIERAVQVAPQKGVPYDPRMLLAGMKLSQNSWRAGFFDKNSFVEMLGGWAKTVIIGRGRLGGIPMGVIVTENRTAELTKPADPADLSSQEKLVQQAGGVWFPDSAYKTAQALRDFNREGLPCIVLANWRGFSGGQRDMFDEVLKFGSMIVDALVAYQQPLFVYIPPFAELRGGAWVVVDSTINSEVMEFYAAEDARGGVLEAAGAASIKFREKEILDCAHRNDHVLQRLDHQLHELLSSVSPSSTSKDLPQQPVVTSREEELRREIKTRERQLYGVYQQIAVHFADLHDTPGRMQAKGVIRKQVNWVESRVFFYYRLKRRLVEFAAMNAINEVVMDSAPHKLSRKVLGQQLQEWFVARSQPPPNMPMSDHAAAAASESFDNDRFMVQWYENNHAALQQWIEQQRVERQGAMVKEQLQGMLLQATTSAPSSQDESRTVILARALSSLSAEERALLTKALTQG